MAHDAIERGELVRVLSDMRPATADLYVLHPGHHGLAAKVRVFIDALVMRVHWTTVTDAIGAPIPSGSDPQPDRLGAGGHVHP